MGTAQDVEARITGAAQLAERTAEQRRRSRRNRRGVQNRIDADRAAATNLDQPSKNPTATETLVVSQNSSTIREDQIASVLRFPSDLGKEGSPYILFTIYETQTGVIGAEDSLSSAVRSGIGAIENTAAALGRAVPGSDAVGGAAVGAVVGGGIGALIGAGVGLETAANTVNQAGNVLFGTGTTGADSLLSRSKELLKNFALKRNISQAKHTIGLFIPDGITTNYSHDYETLSVSATLGLGGLAAQSLAAKSGKVEDMNPYIMESAGRFAERLLGGDENLTKLGLYATTGRVVNPQLETIYTSPSLREFTFDFRMIPRSEEEADDILDIIYLFKLYSAPIIPEGSSGRYFIPPAQFRIQFFNKDGEENLSLFKTKNCVLKSISLDYSPNGYASFDDGMPVETRMQLNFQETVIIDRDAVRGGY